jgi:hypothetical protein
VCRVSGLSSSILHWWFHGAIQSFSSIGPSFFDSRFPARMLVSQFIDVTHLSVHYSKHIFIFGILVALIGSKNGSFTLTKN